MKKLVVGLLTMTMLVSAGTTITFARCHRVEQEQKFICADCNMDCDDYNTTSACLYVDANGDGICDNCDVQQKNNMGNKGHGKNFIDMDGDGICDHYVVRQSRGQGKGCHRGRHCR